MIWGRIALFLAGAAFVLTGQQPSERYGPLIRALGLTEGPDGPRVSTLDGAQKSKLIEIARVLQRWDTSAGAMWLGLMDREDWPTDWPCPPSSDIRLYAKEFGLTAEQVHRLEQLQQEVRQQANDGLMDIAKRIWKLWQAGQPSYTAAIEAETAKWVKQRDRPQPPREVAMAMLSEAQKAKFAIFRADVELAREALELHLIRAPQMPEVLCH